jgi:hypothetical protein
MKKETSNRQTGAVLMVFMSIFFLGSCQQGDERFREKAALEGEESAKKQIEAEKEYLEGRAVEMESDLARRQRFYTGVSGMYEGIMQGADAGDTFKVRFTFAPSLPPYKSNRTRALDEIIQDLNNLHFNVQVIQWTEDGIGSGIAFGCVFQNVRPDLETGQMHLAATDCPSLYSINLAEDGLVPSLGQIKGLKSNSARFAQALLNEQQELVTAIKGFRQVTKSSTIFNFAVTRIEP